MTPPLDMNRRGFLKTGSAAGATLTFGRLSWPQLSAAEATQALLPVL